MKNDRMLPYATNLIPVVASASQAATRSDRWESSGPRPAFGGQRLLSSSSGSSGQGQDNTVRVRRRRRSEPAGPEGRERAEAPRRRRTDSQGPAIPPPSGTGGTGGGTTPSARPPLPSGLPFGGGRSPVLLIGLLVVICVCATAAMLLFDGGGSDDTVYNPPPPTSAVVDSSIPDLPTTLPQAPTTAPEPFVPPAASSSGESWLIMLYQDADDKMLEQDIYVDLNEAERVGSSDRVHIVAQVDRYKAGYQGDGNWSDTKRFYVTQDDDLQRVHSQQVEALGEVNMSDGTTLVDFVTWAVETFPADKYALIMSDHGMGWPGGWSDPDPRSSGDRSIPLSSALGDQLYLMELDEALGTIRAQAGLEQFDLIGLDACLMGHLEVLSALAPHARYAVASQETEPALGWAYTGFLQGLQQNPDMDGAELSRLIVDSYIQDDQRIVDDEARAELLGRGSSMGGLFGGFGAVSAQQLARQMEESVTLTAVDLAAVPELSDRVNDLAFALQSAKQQAVARARTYAQSFTSVFGRNVPPSYIDLGNFAQLLQRESGDRNVVQAADGVLAALNQAVIAEKHGPKKPGATGVSIYFPNSQLYGSPVTGAQSYTAIASRFADESLWDDFLAYHYTGRSFEAATGAIAVPERGTAISAPGTGQIDVSPITLSSDVAAPGQPVLLSTDIQGQNIGYILLFVGFYDQASNSIFVADTDYLESDGTREIDGVYYPVWDEGSQFTMEFEWEPIVYAIDDGVDSVVAMFTPQSYGVSPEKAVYTVDGTYRYADGGESRYARLYFGDGMLRQVFGFTGEGGTGAPHEIFPQAGDTFTVLEKWLDLDQSGKVAQVASQQGGTLTFGEQMFAWKELDAAPGRYIVGFVVQDLDGNSYEEYTQVTVE